MNKNGESEKGSMLVLLIASLSLVGISIYLDGYLLALYAFLGVLVAGESLYLEDSKENSIILFGNVTFTQMIIVFFVLINIFIAIDLYA